MTSGDMWDQCCNIPLWNFFICHPNILVTLRKVDVTYYRAFREWSGLPKVMMSLSCTPLLQSILMLFLLEVVFGLLGFCLRDFKRTCKTIWVLHEGKNRVCCTHLISEPTLFSLAGVPCCVPLIPNSHILYGIAHVFKGLLKWLQSALPSPVADHLCMGGPHHWSPK